MKSGAFINLMTEDKQIDELRDLLSIGEVTEDNKIAFSQTAVMEVDELLPHTQRITRDVGYKQLLEDLKNPDKTNWELPNGMEDILRLLSDNGISLVVFLGSLWNGWDFGR